MDSQGYMNELLQRARKAQKVVEGYSQRQVDMLVKAIAKTVFENAEMLARMAVDETCMGVYEHKVKKNIGKARVIWNELRGKKSVGVLRVIEEEGITEIARPMGVIGAITPTTNPIVTPMCNAMFAVKGRNAVIICPHPRSKNCSGKTVELINQQLAKLGAPENLIQIISEPSVELSGLVMESCDVCISTGGAGMVKAAYSSGKPAFGVGVGNVQCIIDRDVDFAEAVPKIIEGRAFDNGIICSGEQTAIIPREHYKEIVKLFEDGGAFYTEDPQMVQRLRDVLFVDGVMNKNIVGRSALEVAKLAGIDVPTGTQVLLVKADGSGTADSLAKEKMCPVIAAYKYDGFEEAVRIACDNLAVEGAGHSVSVHSSNRDHIEYVGNTAPVSRILVNQICATMNGGSFFNGLSATTTLGCGSWGNNSISENLSYRHLFNISRIAMPKPGAVAAQDDELWGD